MVKAFLRDIYFVLKKELLVHYRNMSALSVIVLFVVISVSLPVFAFAGSNVSQETAVVLLWNACFFVAITICQRSFGLEVSEKTLLFMRLCFSASVIFWGKWFFNFCLIALSAIIATIGFSLGTSLHFGNIGILSLSIFLYSVSISSLLIVISAIGSDSSQSDSSAIAVLAFPLVIAVLWLVIKATLVATETDAPLFRAGTELELLGVFSLVSLPISYLLFEIVWES